MMSLVRNHVNSATDFKMALSQRDVYETMSKTLTLGEQKKLADKKYFFKVAMF